MGVKIKTFNEMLNDMASWMSSRTSKVNNFQVGSVIRTLLEAVASELQTLYFEMSRSIKYAIENSTFESFGFKTLPAVSATGEVTAKFYNALTSSLLIPQGFRFYTIPIYGKTIYFETISDVNCPSGASSVVLQVQCVEAGTVGNVPSNSIRYMSVNTYMISEVRNEKPFFNGKPEETKQERKKRFNDYIDTLSKGTLGSILYGCLSVPDVSGVYLDELIGEIHIYAHDVFGNLSDDLKEQINTTLVNYRAAGIPVTVYPVVKRYVDVQLKVYLAKGYEDYTESYMYTIQDKVTSYLDAFKVAKGLYLSDLVFYVKSIDDMAISYVEVVSPEDTVSVGKEELIRSGTVTAEVTVES